MQNLKSIFFFKLHFRDSNGVPYCPALTDPSWLCLVPLGLDMALFCSTMPGAVLPDPARYCPALYESARSRRTLPVLPWFTQPGSTLYPAWPHTALYCPSRPCPVLLTMPGLAQPCPAITGPSWPRPVLFGPARHFPTLPGSILRCPAWACPTHPCPALSDTVWPCPVRTNYHNCRFYCVQCIE